MEPPLTNLSFGILNQQLCQSLLPEKRLRNKQFVQIGKWQFSSYDISLLVSETLQGIVCSRTTGKTFRVEVAASFAKLSPIRLISLQTEIQKNFYVRMIFSNENPCRIEFNVRGEGGGKELIYTSRRQPLELIPQGNASLKRIPKTPQEVAWVMSQPNTTKQDKEWCFGVAKKFIDQFNNETLHSNEDINGLVTLIFLNDKNISHNIIGLLIDKIANSKLLNLYLVHALARAVDRANPDHLNSDDLFQLTIVLAERLKTTHKTEESQVMVLSALIRILNAMVDVDFRDFSRNKQEELKKELKTLQSETRFASIYNLIAYALEALRRIPNDEKKLAKFLRYATGICAGIYYFSAAVYKIEPKHLVDGFFALKDNFKEIMEFAKEIKEKFADAAPDLIHGFQALKQSEALNISLELSWYDQIRYVDLLIESNAFCALEQFLRNDRLRKEPGFFYALVLKLNEVVFSHPNSDTKKETILLLRDLYRQDEVWHPEIVLKDPDFKKAERKAPWVAIKAAIISQLALSQQEPNLKAEASAVLELIKDSAESEEKEFIEQHCKDAILSSPPIAAPASLFSRIVQDDIEIKIDKMRDTLAKNPSLQEVYIPLMCNSSGDIQDLQTQVIHFLEGNMRVLLIKGESGAGKSRFCHSLVHHIFKNYRPHTGVIPLYVSLSKLPQKLFSQTLKPFRFTSGEIQQIKVTRELVIILDGLDELPPDSELIKINELLDYKAKVIVTCRSQACPYEELLIPKKGGFHRIDMLPFSPAQINQFIDESIQFNQHKWNHDKYIAEIQRIEGLNDLIKNPFILKIVIDILPKIVEQRIESSFPSQQSITHFDLYQTFIDDWFENEFERQKTKFLELPKEWNLTPKNFKREALNYCIELANAFSNANRVCVPFNWQNATEALKKLLGDDPKIVFLRSLSPLKITDQEVSFIHKSLLEHFISVGTEELLAAFDKRRTERKLKEDKSEQAKFALTQIFNQPLYKTLLEPSIWQDLAEKTRYDQHLQKTLLDIVKTSKDDPRMAIAAANAITILNLAHFSFIGEDLSGVQIRGAWLERSVFAETDLRDADLSRANLTNAVLINPKCTGTKMEGVEFGQFPMIELRKVEPGQRIHFKKMIIKMIISEDKQRLICAFDNSLAIFKIETGELLKTFPCRHPGQIENLALFNKEKSLITILNWLDEEIGISVWDIETGVKQLEFKGHTNKVTGLTVLENEKKLVTASKDSTIRIWDLNTGKQIKRLSLGMSFSFDDLYMGNHFTSLIALKGGQFLASGNQNGNIQIWETSTGKKIRLLKGHTWSDLGVKVLQTSEDGERMISSDQKEVRIWDISAPNPNLWKLDKRICESNLCPLLPLENCNKFAFISEKDLVIKDIRSEQSIQKLPIGNIEPSSLIEVEPGKRLVALKDDKFLQFYDLKSSDTLKKRASEFFPSYSNLPINNTFISYDPDDKDLIYQTHWTWDCLTGQLLKKENIKRKEDIKISSTREIRYENENCSIVIWDLEKGKVIKRLKAEYSSDSEVKFATKKFIVIRHFYDRDYGSVSTLRVWDTESGRDIGNIESPRQVLLSNDTQLVIESSSNSEYDTNAILLWDVITERKPKILFKDPEKNCNNLILLGKDKVAFILREFPDTIIKIFDLISEKQLHQLPAPNYATSITTFDDGRKLISYGSDLRWNMRMRVWDVCTGKELAQLQYSGTGTTHVFGENPPLFTGIPEQNLLVIADEHVVRLWNYESNTVEEVRHPLKIIGLELRPVNDHYLLFATVQSGGVWCWKLIQVDGRYKTTLLWTTDPFLICTGMKVDNIQGLSEGNKRLLIQHGAIDRDTII